MDVVFVGEVAADENLFDFELVFGREMVYGGYAAAFLVLVGLLLVIGALAYPRLCYLREFPGYLFVRFYPCLFQIPMVTGKGNGLGSSDCIAD